MLKMENSDDSSWWTDSGIDYETLFGYGLAFDGVILLAGNPAYL